ncbi:MAG: hypothetical protein VX405_02470 [Myxococcota bacterium]|nr:hypothetical protein [Myxococcota bacterium]
MYQALMIGLWLLPKPLPVAAVETVTTNTPTRPEFSQTKAAEPHRRRTAFQAIPESTQRHIMGRSLLLGGILGGLGGYVGFQMGQRHAETVCLESEGCSSDWILPFTGTLLGAGAGLIFAPGYVAGNAGYRCDMDKRILAYAGGAGLGSLLMALGGLSQDAQTFATGLALPFMLPITACLSSLEPIALQEISP